MPAWRGIRCRPTGCELIAFIINEIVEGGRKLNYHAEGVHVVQCVLMSRRLRPAVRGAGKRRGWNAPHGIVGFLGN
jgi:hypothetical protein